MRLTVAIHGRSPRVLSFADDVLVGSGPAADVRILDAALAPLHLRLMFDGGELMVWALASGASLAGEALIEDYPQRVAGRPITVGPVEIYVARIEDDPGVVLPAVGEVPPRRVRTDSLARELVRELLAGDAGAPLLVPELAVEAGPVVGQRRALPPPGGRLVVGRGDTASWVLFDPELSRHHAAFEHRADGVWVIDLASKNGTFVDGDAAPADGTGVLIADGARIELGDTVLRYRDPAAAMLVELEARLRPGPSPRADTRARDRRSLRGRGPRRWGAVAPWPVWGALAIAAIATALLIALIASA